MAEFAIAVWSADSKPVAHGGKFRSALADRNTWSLTIEGHRPCEAQTVAAGGRRIRALCPRHVRAPSGGRCQGEPDRGNVYVRWRPRSCAPKKGAIVR